MRWFLHVAWVVVVGVAVAAGCKTQATETTTTTATTTDAGGDKAKTMTLKVQVPQFTEHLYVDAKLFVDDKEHEIKGEEPKITVKTDKPSVVVKVVWEPNNYTKITRFRKVAVKEGEVAVDLRKASDTEKDDIVVRFVPTPSDFVEEMCKLAKVGKDDVVYDLGCGDARMVIIAVKKFGAKKGVGVELDPKLVKLSKEKVKEAGLEKQIEIREGDVLKVDDLSDATVVLLYMGDDINARLKPILKKTLKPGSRVVSHRFLMGDDWPPDTSKKLTSTDTSMPYFQGYTERIHLWEIKAPKK